MKNVLIIMKTETVRRDGKTYIRSIKAAGLIDDSGKFRMTQCFGKIYPAEADACAHKTVKNVA